MKKYIIAKGNEYFYGIYEIVYEAKDKISYKTKGHTRIFQSNIPPRDIQDNVAQRIDIGSHCRFIEAYPEQLTLEYLQNLYKK